MLFKGIGAWEGGPKRGRAEQQQLTVCFAICHGLSLTPPLGESLSSCYLWGG